MGLFDFIQRINKMPDPIATAIAGSFKKEQHTKGAIIHQQDAICKKLYYIQQGFLRLYYNKEGKDITSWFSIENSIITAPDSFFQHAPSRYSLEVLEETELYSITIEQIESLLDQYPEMERLARLLTYSMLNEITEKVYSLQFQTAHERYEYMLEKHPYLLKRASLGHIASYLGMTQETLSRIRSPKYI